jgi:hypothetical protein
MQPTIAVLMSGESGVKETARGIAAGRASAGPAPSVSLLDLQEDVGSKTGLDEKEKDDLRRAVEDARERLDRLGKIRRERDEVLKDLKEKVSSRFSYPSPQLIQS